MDNTWSISTIRAQETVDATSPAAVLARIEREQSLGRPGPLRNALVEALWGARDTAVALASSDCACLPFP